MGGLFFSSANYKIVISFNIAEKTNVEIGRNYIKLFRAALY
jgi:hypothetical protein